MADRAPRERVDGVEARGVVGGHGERGLLLRFVVCFRCCFFFLSWEEEVRGEDVGGRGERGDDDDVEVFFSYFVISNERQKEKKEDRNIPKMFSLACFSSSLLNVKKGN